MEIAGSGVVLSKPHASLETCAAIWPQLTSFQDFMNQETPLGLVAIQGFCRENATTVMPRLQICHRERALR
jgi:hypothetical protein